jgi:PleD family two-component response regulator
MHGGTVSARSPGLDQGSEFVVKLPMLAQVPRHIAVMGAPRSFPPRRVLIVDDNRDAAESLSTLLNILGARASVAYSGREALNVLDAIHPEAVLLDIGMPGMDGYEVAQQIRSNPAHADSIESGARRRAFDRAHRLGPG